MCVYYSQIIKVQKKHAAKWFFDMNMLKASVDQIFESVFLLILHERNIQKGRAPTYVIVCVCISFCSIGKKR